NELGEIIMQDKMFGIFKEHHRWQDILGMRTIGDLNECIGNSPTPQLPNSSTPQLPNSLHNSPCLISG
ncbi:MAG: hypothetical protein K5928_08885, partial [Prevotella sp.]|nr:hypothetical protein [Prevotella sp.]